MHSNPADLVWAMCTIGLHKKWTSASWVQTRVSCTLRLWDSDCSLKAWLWAFCVVCVFLKKHLWICWEYLIHEWAVKKPAQPQWSSRSSLWALSVRRALLLSDTQVAIQKRQRDVVFWHQGGYYGNIVARPLWWHSACVFQCSFLPEDSFVVTMVTLN